MLGVLNLAELVCVMDLAFAPVNGKETPLLIGSGREQPIYGQSTCDLKRVLLSRANVVRLHALKTSNPKSRTHSTEKWSFSFKRYNNIYYIIPFYYTPGHGIIQEKSVAERGAF